MTPSILVPAMILSLGGDPVTGAQDSTPPGFNTPIPESIMTSDEVETSIGTLRFFDGMPTA
ncbi:MAG: hypothetical protein GWP75_02725, partial [Planctomycetia bacterium]|nr:hypothetical protein [Planctomycetia bacterium]